jgi:hypothetical protein
MTKKKKKKEVKAVKPKREVDIIVSVSYTGYDHDIDRKLERTVGRKLGGAGYGFGSRDVNFYFKQEKAAKVAAAKLKRLKCVKRVTIETYDWTALENN